MPNPQQTLRRLTRRRAIERDELILRFGRAIDAWSRRVERNILGTITANRGGQATVQAALDRIVANIPGQAADVIKTGLETVWDWAWVSATQNWVASIPLLWWVQRLMPAKPMRGVEARQANGGGMVLLEDLDPEDELAKIVNGQVSAAEAREIVRRFEFPPPSPQKVDVILRGGYDGVDAMSRIKTVIAPDLEDLRQVLNTGLATIGTDGAAAVPVVSKRIRQFFDQDYGTNYKAQRIARTEAMRVAEAGQQETRKAVEDLLQGVRTWTAGDSRVRSEHRQWHNKLYVKQPDGRYVHPTLGELPNFPAGPNCRCFSEAELMSDLTAGIPPANYGVGYDEFQKRLAAAPELTPAELVT